MTPKRLAEFWFTQFTLTGIKPVWWKQIYIYIVFRGARARPQGVMLAARAGEASNVIEGTAEPVALPAPEAQSEPTPAPKLPRNRTA